MRQMLFLVFLGVAFDTSATRAADLRFFDDATLRAVQFIDAKEGWAAGDEGIILHTIDGGQSWERQVTGVRASLRSVCFLDPYVGWAVGREELPSGGSLGVVLFTRDGGVEWQRLLPGALPGLNQVRFLDKRTGFLLADTAEQFPSGLFKTTDGGKTWDPVMGPPASGWRGADFHDANTGVLVGPWKGLVTLRQGVFGKAHLDERGDLGARCLHAVQILPQRIVAVGDGGLVLTSASAGAAWGFADLQLPKDVAACLDFRAIHGVGKHAWVVGRPGSFVLATTDAGATWALQPTGHTTPLHGVFFLDSQRGWAVGDLGAILSSNDGGKTWKVQRQGAKRSSALFVHARGEDIPMDTIAALGAQQGYVTSALRVVAADPASAPPRRAADDLRLAAAARLAGGATAESLWHFPHPPHLAFADKHALLEHWNRGHGNRADREVLRQLVLALRIWRPDCVITDALDGKSSHPPGTLVAEALVEAVKQAGDAKTFPEQLDTLGLHAWQVKRLFAPGEGGVVQDNHEPHQRLHGTLREFAFDPANLLSDARTAIPPRREYRLLASADAGAAAGTTLIAGLNPTVGDARRPIDSEERPDPQLVDVIRQRRHLLALAENLKQDEHALAQIAALLRKLPDEQAAPAVFTVADLFARRGQWDLAREAFLLMVDRYPAHPLSADAYRWLIRHNTSSEVRRRYELQQFVQVKNLSFHENPEFTKNKPGNPIQQTNAVEPVQNHQLVYLGNQSTSREWQRGSLEFGKRLSAFGPLFSSDPSVQFCLQASKRRLGDAKAGDWYGRFKNYVTKGPWHDAAHAEDWLANRNGPTPRRLALCRLTDRRPHLDGKLDDACWQGLKPLVLEDASGAAADDYPTEVRFAYDQEFLYVALRCRHPEGLQQPLVKERGRDADLDAFDRVGLLFDLDRDYATYYHMQVDQRGCVRDDCWGDLSWSPKWYVSAVNDATSWTIEAAIPLGELTREPVELGSAWACNIVRTIPGKGVQAYSLPADTTPRPEGMCLLLFQQDPARNAAQPMQKAP